MNLGALFFILYGCVILGFFGLVLLVVAVMISGRKR